MESTIRLAIATLLSRGHTVGDLATALGVPPQKIHDASLGLNSSPLREVPNSWYDVLAEIAWSYPDLEALAQELERSKSYGWFEETV